MIDVRPATVEDWPEFWPMLEDMGSDDTAEVAHPRYVELLADPRWGVLVASDQARLIGYVSLQDYGPHLRIGSMHRIIRMHDLYVLPDERRRGVGTTLLEAAKVWTAEHGRYLEWQAGATTSAPFYERIGYRGEPCPQPEYPTFVIDFAEA